MFRAAIRIIDHDKRAALNQQLLQSVGAIGPNEKLDEMLAALNSHRDPVRVNCKKDLAKGSAMLNSLQYHHRALMNKLGGMDQGSKMSSINVYHANVVHV